MAKPGNDGVRDQMDRMFAKWDKKIRGGNNEKVDEGAARRHQKVANH